VNQLREILIERLEKRGVPLDMVPGLFRDLVNTLSTNPDTTLQNLNRRLHLLGWNGFELDEHTLQLVIANFEAEELKEQGALRVQASEPHN
jgi:hypothetical protein